MRSSLSVCIPVFNQAEFVGEAIDSLLRQSVAPLEIVVSENHSTDDTHRVVSEFSRYIRLVRPPEHLSMRANFSFAAAQARGTWLTFIGSDDRVRPDYVERIQKGLQKCDDRDVVVFGGLETIDASGSLVETSAIFSFPRRASSNVAFNLLLDGTKLSLESTVVRHDAFRAVGGFGNEAILVFDWALFLRLSSLGSFYNLRRYLGQKRYWNCPDRIAKHRADQELRDFINIYSSCIAPRVQGIPLLKEKALNTIRNKFIYTILAASSQGRLIKDFEMLDVLPNYQSLLGFQGTVETFLRDEGFYPMQQSSSVARSHRTPMVRAARQIVALLLGWR